MPFLPCDSFLPQPHSASVTKPVRRVWIAAGWCGLLSEKMRMHLQQQAPPPNVQ